MPLPLDDNGNPLTRVYIPTGNLPLDNSAQGLPDGSADPNAIGVNASDVQMPTKDSIIDKLLGTNGVERYQLWPEKLIRDALSAPAQVMQSNPYKEGTEENLAFENMRQGAMPQAALNMSALAGTGGLAGVGAEAGTSLGAGPFLRPALKYEGKIYKAPVGGQHMDAIPKDLQPEFTRQAMSGEDISNFDFGFMNHKGHFLNREDALKYAIDEGLMSPHDAKYGALTSTLMADSSKEAAAIDATAKTEPFYSAVEKQVDQVNQPKMTGDQWLGTLANKPGVKPEELDWTGVKDFLQNKGKEPVTKAELQEHLANNKVELREVDKGQKSWDSLTKEEKTKVADNFEDQEATRLKITDSRLKDWYDKEQLNPTKYHSYQLPGGENYREKLLTLPDRINPELKTFGKELEDKYGHNFQSKLSQEEKVKWNSLFQENLNPNQYKSSHWDEPNILAHVRMNDRMVDGKKSLHLEEIQSDWHQQGRDKGYQNPKNQASEEEISKLVKADSEARIAATAASEKAWKEATGGKAENQRQFTDTGIDRHELRKAQEYVNDHPERNAAYDKSVETHRALNEAMERGKIGVPDAPFKKTWHELALKRMVREAVEKGYDRLSWTPGEAQAARYDLSKQIDKLAYNPKTGHLQGFKDGGMSLDNQVPKNKLADFVGKEAAEKLLNKPTKILGNGYHTLENADLKIGGEGMKSFYDQIIPKALEKITGEKVKQFELKAAPKYEIKNPILNKNGKEIVSVYKDGEFQADMEKSEAKHYIETKQKSDKPSTANYIDITPALKEKAMKGFPLFSSTKFAPAMEAYSNTDNK